MPTNVFFVLFIVATILQLGYGICFLLGTESLPKKKILKDTNYSKKVSLIICAKNESSNLVANLPKVLSQEYHNSLNENMFEVIVVDDSSSDNSLNELHKIKVQYDNLKIVSTGVGNRQGGKKVALSMGVASASYDLLLFTDGDCSPASCHWLSKMVAPLNEGKEIVLGYSGFYPQKGLLNAFIRWETLHTFIQYATYFRFGLLYMGVGRNLACTKELFCKAESLPSWNALPYGDDDFLVKNFGNKHNSDIVCDADAFTYSMAKQTVNEYINQKQRHLSTGKYHRPAIVILLGVYGFAHVVMWLTLLNLLQSSVSTFALSLLLIRCLLYWFTWFRISHKMDIGLQSYFLPLFDLLWMVYNFVFSPYIFYKNKKNWK